LALYATSVSVVLAEEIAVAAASSLNFAFKDVVSDYEKKTGDHVKLSLGSSGNFYSQITNGAPFDVFFSADLRYPQKLEESGLAVPGSLSKYALGKIVLWVPKDSKLDLEKGIEALADPSVRKIAIANPKHAPYGRAAVQALEHLKLYDRTKDRLVFGENISQAAQFVTSGNCDAGIISLSLALSPSMKSAGRYVEIPLESHSPVEHGAVIVKNSTHQEAAKRFLEYVKAGEGKETLQRYGFELPDSMNGAGAQ
jgi:molybdate transport system substrate-binding protein